MGVACCWRGDLKPRLTWYKEMKLVLKETRSTKLRKNSTANTGQLSDVHKGTAAGGQHRGSKQIRLFGRLPSSYKHNEFRRPGELLVQDACYISKLQGIGRVYLHTVVDVFSFFAFGFLHASKAPEGAVAILHNEVLPFYRERHIPVEAVQTDNCREFCGQGLHLFELYLALNQIHHCYPQSERQQSNCSAEYFRRTVMAEFFRIAFRQKSYESIETLRQDLDVWLRHYNYQRPSVSGGQGEAPGDIIQAYLAARQDMQQD